MERPKGDSGLPNGMAGSGFSIVVDENYTRIYRFLLKLTGNTEDTKDLTQQAFLEAYRRFADFRGESSLSSWLHGIALNLARNHRRRTAATRIDDVGDLLENLPADEASPEGATISRQMLSKAMAILNALPLETRQAFALVALDGWSYEEAASRMGVPVATIRGRVARTRAKIREQVSVTETASNATHIRIVYSGDRHDAADR